MYTMWVYGGLILIVMCNQRNFKMKKLIAVTLMSILIFSCNQNTTNPENKLFTVKGYISSSTGMISGANVVLDNSVNWTTTTSSNGYFEIGNVSEGVHSLSLKKSNNDGSFSEIKNTISVYSDVFLESLLLPNPILMYPPADVSSNSMKIVWSKSDATDFYEYKLYRHDTPGLDETTGELIFVSISKLDTSFNDINLFSNKDYYYRVYQMNNLGRIGGSNIVTSRTILSNLIPDGDFENSNSLDINWISTLGSPNNSLILSDSIKYSGNYSLYASYNGFGQYPPPMIKIKKVLNVAQNTQYVLSVMVKIDGRRGNTDDIFINMNQGSEYYILYVSPPRDPITGYVNIEWTKFTKSFLTLNSTPLEITIIFNNENIWIDDIELKPLE